MALVELGWSAQDAVAQAKMLRSERVLSNRHFQRALGLQS